MLLDVGTSFVSSIAAIWILLALILEDEDEKIRLYYSN